MNTISLPLPTITWRKLLWTHIITETLSPTSQAKIQQRHDQNLGNHCQVPTLMLSYSGRNTAMHTQKNSYPQLRNRIQHWPWLLVTKNWVFLVHSRLWLDLYESRNINIGTTHKALYFRHFLMLKETRLTTVKSKSSIPQYPSEQSVTRWEAISSFFYGH